MKWYKLAYEVGHGDTLNGQLMNRELRRILAEIDELRAHAVTGGPDDVLPRWRHDVRRSIYLLPSKISVTRMSMMELEQVSAALSEIRDSMAKFSISRFKEIVNAN